MGALARPRQLGLQLLDSAEHVLERDRAVLEQHLGGVRGADAHLPFLLALAETLGAGGHDKARLPARAQLGFHGGTPHVNVGDPPVGDEDLLAVEDPAAVLVHGPRLHRRDVGARLRLGNGESAQRRLLDRAEAGRDPGRDLLRGALREDGGDREAGALDGQRNAGAAPGQLLGDQGRHDAGAVGVCLLQEVDAIEPHLGGLLDHRPGKLLRFVVLRGDRAEVLLGDAMDPIPELTLLVDELERNHLSPDCNNARPASLVFTTRWYWYVPFYMTLRRIASTCQ